MRDRRGGGERAFTLMEVLVAVAVLGIVAAIVVPALVRARAAANESATIGDIRTMMSAQAAYRVANAGFHDSNLDCLVSPSAINCIPNYPTNGPTFLDSQLAALTAKAGYNRVWVGGPRPLNLPANASPTSATRYRYDATPTVGGVTGVRGFGGDQTERICFTRDGSPIPPGTPVEQLPANCQELR